MEYIHLAENDDGISYFEDRNVLMELKTFAPPAPDLFLSDPVSAEQLVFLTLPAGWGGKQHPTPREQIAFCLSGRIRVEAGSGEVREIGAGGIWWMTDTAGSGHFTTVLGDEEVRLAIVQLT